MPPRKSSAGKWVLIGCGGCLGLAILGVVMCVTLFFGASKLIRKTDVYENALKHAQNSAEVQAALGTPIETGWSFSGSVNYTNGSGEASFTVPLTGPKGEGTLNVKADKTSGGPWRYSTLEVEFPDGHKTDLRDKP
ncbi:cytochrome c oxidase assembly factor 1 family protein [Prosthecobacter sp.]|uniref:cytochrome c oxidase assembly factor 1 family protein n=1 Tax=Prosthecobacter sp. TaxID=1965333 RepID=UPI003784F0B5